MTEGSEVFPNPTVKQVIFQIRFPNLFYMDSKIGDLQMLIMEEFPESSLLFRKQIVIADVGPEYKVEDLSDKINNEPGKKIWQFVSPRNYRLNVLADSLDITSEFHKTYDSKNSDNRFRDIIQFVLSSFFEVTKVPLLTRVGLRYIDECPLPQKSSDTYTDYYNTAFNFSRFGIEEAIEMDFKTVINRGKYSLRYIETLQEKDGTHFVIIDSDAFAHNIKSSDCLSVTDELHDFVIKEYFRTVKPPVLDYMRRQG